jgi:hypothetical protein
MLDLRNPASELIYLFCHEHIELDYFDVEVWDSYTGSGVLIW